MAIAHRTGAENLDAMEAAVNYNGHLLSLARWAVRPHEQGIDFGAGRGTFALPMARDGCRIISVEPDPDSRAVLQSHGLMVRDSLSDLPAKAFDGAWSFNVLEHIEDDASALSDLRRVLRPNGRLALYVPAFPILFSEMDHHVGHWRRYRRGALVSLARRCGFSVERSYYVDCLGFPAAFAYRVLRFNGHIDPAAVRLYDRWIFPLSRTLDRLCNRMFGKNVVLKARRRT